MLKMTVGGVTVDFASMIEEVVNDENANTFEPCTDATKTQLRPEMIKSQLNTNTQTSPTVTSPEATSQGLVQTPEAPEV
jgi:hypothetical protein